MQTIEAMKKQIKSAEDLQSVVKTMKALAAVNIRLYERAVKSLAEYNRTIMLGLQVALRHKGSDATLIKASPNQQVGAIIFGSDQGMCGQLNSQIVAFALAQMKEQNGTATKLRILAVGARVLTHLDNAGLSVEEYFAVPNSLHGVNALVQEIMLKVEEWRSRRGLDRVTLYYHKPLPGASYQAQALQLLPIDWEWFRSLEQQPWPSRVLPTFTMNWEQLLAALIRQYLYVSLYRAAAESLASENASRLAAMQGAEKSIEQRLEELTANFHRHRQSAITEELFDIVAGFEALIGNDGRQPR